MFNEKECRIIRDLMQDMAGRTAYTQFGYKNAWVTNDCYPVYDNDERRHFIEPFMSYRTVVAFVDITDKIVYECGKYSTTNSKQVTQFHRKYYPLYDRILAYK